MKALSRGGEREREIHMEGVHEKEGKWLDGTADDKCRKNKQRERKQDR
jgi:hypothetical protein